MDAIRQELSMRQLATLPNADAARTLADHLLTLRIDTHLDEAPEGWVVWVRDEDRLPQAKQELAEFMRDPGDKRFAAARKAAEATRRRLEKEEQEYAAFAPARTAPAALSAPRPGPWTNGLIVACCMVFVLDATWVFSQNLAQGAPQALMVALHLTPESDKAEPSPVEQALAFSSYEMKLGNTVLPWPRQIMAGQVWRLLTPIFLHFGPFHLLFNMFMLYQLGGMIEDRRGPWRFLLLVLVFAVPSNVAQYALSAVAWKDGGLVAQMPPLFGGMSGVLYGLFGYVWMKSRYEPALGLELGPRIVVWMIAWLFLCMTGLVGPIANTAHVVGLLFGVVIGVAPHLWRLARGRRPT